MADSKIITIPLYLPSNEATALARIASRIGPEHCDVLAPFIDVEVSMSATYPLLGALTGDGH